MSDQGGRTRVDAVVGDDERLVVVAWIALVQKLARIGRVRAALDLHSCAHALVWGHMKQSLNARGWARVRALVARGALIALTESQLGEPMHARKHVCAKHVSSGLAAPCRCYTWR